MTPAALAWVLAFLALGYPPPRGPEVLSPLGVAHYSRPDHKGAVLEATRKLAASPNDVDLLIALGRAHVSILQLRQAIETFTRAMPLVPREDRTRQARLYRLRGHRYISSRQFDRGAKDLARAAELSDKEFDIWYHLGLAHYLRGDFARAAAAYGRARDVSTKDDQIIASSNWLYASLRRQGREEDAARVLERITPTMKVVEDKMYFALLLLYKGLKQESETLPARPTGIEAATIGYGIANWHLYNGRRDRAEQLFRDIVAGTEWAAFGFIAAETELSRRGLKASARVASPPTASAGP